MKKVLSLLAVAAMLLVCLAAFTVSADEGFVWLTPEFGDNNASTLGPRWLKHDEIEVTAGEGNDIVVTNTAEGAHLRSIWAWPESESEDYHFFRYEVISSGEGARITVSNNLSGKGEQVDLDITPGEHCVCIADLVADFDSLGWHYVAVYPGPMGTITFRARASETDENGNVYVKPTQPPVPDGDTAHMIRYNLPAYTADHVEEDTGFSWLMSADVTVEPKDKGFVMRRSEGADAAAVNIAWVVPDAQLAQTPYLVIEIANEGRPDEGPQVAIYSYWEHVVGSLAVFDNMGVKYHGANGLNGVNAYNLKYAVDNVREDLHGEDGIAIIVGLDLSSARTDGTVLDDLVITDAYLMGWEDGYAGSGLFVDMGNEPATPTTAKPDTQPTQSGNNNNNNNEPAAADKGTPTWLWIAIGGAVVVVAVVVAVVVLGKKKK